MDYKILPLAAPPSTQALTSKTFKPPPLDGSLTVPEIFDWHLENTPSHSLFVYADEGGSEHSIMWPEAVRAIHNAARIIRSRMKPEGSADKRVVAILASPDTITFFTVLMGVLRAGFTVFPISPKNSPAAIADLLKKTDVSHILVGKEPALQALLTDSIALLAKDSDVLPENSPMLSFDETHAEPPEDSTGLPLVHFNLDTVAVIVHSSGSTAHPKPIFWTHYQILQVSMTPYFGEVDMTGLRLATQALPLFHGMGVMQTGWAASAGIIIAAFQPQSSPTVPSPDSVLKSSILTQSDLIFCVPSFVETWAKNPENVSHLRRIRGILYGGGPLNKEIGDSLTAQGVNVFILYGCSEIGVMSPILPKEAKNDWEFFRIPENMKSKFISDEQGGYELVILPHKYEVPCLFNTKTDGTDAYATSDLLSPHPTKQGYWKVIGRVDDQIMHSTGEKTNPVPLESILNQNPRILSSVMFGRGRFNAGVILDPSPEYKFDPQNVIELREFIEQIWPTVEQLNSYAPKHSRIFREMILVSSPSKPFTYTAKNTVRRQTVLADYASQVDLLYVEAKEIFKIDVALPADWAIHNALVFVRATVTAVMKRMLSDSEDVFEFGCDSLQAAWIRNTVVTALDESMQANASIPNNIVYLNPTIETLASYISSLSAGSGSPDDISSGAPDRINEMQNMLEKYGHDFPPHIPSAYRLQSASAGLVMIVTGTTGGLGSILLQRLLDNFAVARVYAINRAGDSSLLERHMRAFEERDFDQQLLLSDKLVLLEGRLSDNDLGLSDEVLDEIRESVSHIIHNAYPVDFNKSLATFEPAIRGTRNLINLALSSRLDSPPRFLFTSSISVVRGCSDDEPVKEESVPAASAVASGYSESKWVCEQLLIAASKETPLQSVSVRIGQLCGMRTCGYWNTNEWVPALVKSSLFLGCLPDISGELSWVPIDDAANVILEIIANFSSKTPILHLVHPAPVTWATVFKPLAQEFGLSFLPYSEWLERLENYAKSNDGSSTLDIEKMQHVPALRILNFFRSAPKGEPSRSSEAMGIRKVHLYQTIRLSQALQNEAREPLTANNARRWAGYWKKAGFLTIPTCSA